MPPKNAAERVKQEELAALRNKINEVEASIKEEKNIHVRQRYDAEQKLQQMAAIERSIAAEKERHKWEVERIVGLKAAKEEATAYRLEYLKGAENEVLEEISNLDFLDAENIKLQKQLKDVAFSHYKITMQRFEEREKRKQKNFDTKMNLDQVLRNAVKMFTSDYQERAVLKMNGEAASAIRENVQLYAKFDAREETCEAMVREQKLSYEKMMKLRIEKELVAATNAMHSSSAKSHNAFLEEHDRKLLQLKAENEDIDHSIVLLRTHTKNKERLVSSLMLLEAKLSEVIENRQLLCKQTLEVAKSLAREGLRLAGKDRTNKNLSLTETDRFDESPATPSATPHGGKFRTFGQTERSLPRGLNYVDEDELDEDTGSIAPSGLGSLSYSFLGRPGGGTAGLGHGGGDFGLTPPGQLISGFSSSTLVLPRLLSVELDAGAVWNSTKSDCHLMSHTLRKLTREKRGKGKEQLLSKTKISNPLNLSVKEPGSSLRKIQRPLPL